MIEKYLYYIYKITSPSNKVYIGQTKWIDSRKSYYKRNRCVKQPLIHRSISKYGWNSHKFEVILKGYYTRNEINEIERSYIKIFKDNSNSLNISDGGSSAPYKIGVYGRKVLQFSLEKKLLKEWISVANVQRELSISALGIASQCRKRRFYYKGFLWIYKEDYENGIIPFRQSNKVPVLVFNRDKHLINEFISITDAARFFKCEKRDISKAIKVRGWYRELFFIKKCLYTGTEEIPPYSGGKKIRCTMNNRTYIFESLKEASKFLNISSSAIIYYCKGRAKKNKKYNLEYV